MRNFTSIFSKIISTNCNPSLYGVFDLWETLCHRISTNRKYKNKGKIIVINYLCRTMILGARAKSLRIAPCDNFKKLTITSC